MQRKNAVLLVIMIVSFILAIKISLSRYSAADSSDWRSTLVIARGVMTQMNQESRWISRPVDDDDNEDDCPPDNEDMKRAILLLPADHGPVYIRQVDDCFVLNEKICSKKNKQEKKIACCHYDLAPIPCDEAQGTEIRKIF